MTAIERGDLWVVTGVEGLDRVLVVTNDKWNAGRMREVLVLPVDDVDDVTVRSIYDVIIDIDGTDHIIRVPQILPVAKVTLAECMGTLGASVMDVVDAALAETFMVTDPAPGGSKRPLGRPLAGQIRWAHLPGVGRKPVVVVSTERYGHETNWTLVIVCRCSTSVPPVRRFEKRYGRGNTKVVVGHAQAMNASTLLATGPPGSVLTGRELLEVRSTLAQILGLH